MADLSLLRPTVVHRFSSLPYGIEHPEMVVAVCDCGWAELYSGPLGSGWDAAQGYVLHIAAVQHSDDTTGGTDG